MLALPPPTPPSPFAAQEADRGFLERQLRFESDTFRYRIRVPVTDAPTAGHPLLLLLHGAGERGDDNRLQLTHLPEDWPGYVLVPQCRADMRWVEAPWDAEQSTPMAAEPAPMLRMALATLDQALERHPIDPDRVYLAGLSMGGYGTWELAQRHPERFAAIVPICGGGDEHVAARIAALPVWAWHSADDPAVPVVRTRAMIAALRAAGGTPRYTELEDAGHFAWLPAFASVELRDWLYAQRRVAPSGTSRWTGALHIEKGSTLGFHTDRGNATRLDGPLSGEGNIVWTGAPSTMAAFASTFGGDEPNTLTGTLHLTRGVLVLAKPKGVTSVAGPLVLGGGSYLAVLRLAASHQVAESPLVVRGPHGARIELDGASEGFGTLALLGDLSLALGDPDAARAPCTIAFADSRALAWNATLMIEGWRESERGPDVIRFGADEQSLTPDQLARIRFRVGDTTRPACLSASGDLQPSAR